MRLIQISDEALDDLSDGYRFHEAQDQGLGDYFTSCLRADIESLRLYAGIPRIVYQNTIGYRVVSSRSGYFTQLSRMRS